MERIRNPSRRDVYSIERRGSWKSLLTDRRRVHVCKSKSTSLGKHDKWKWLVITALVPFASPILLPSARPFLRCSVSFLLRADALGVYGRKEAVAGSRSLNCFSNFILMRGDRRRPGSAVADYVPGRMIQFFQRSLRPYRSSTSAPGSASS